METVIYKNYSEFLKREDKQLNGVSEDFAKENTDYVEDNKTNTGCWNCSDCSSCRSCRSCSYCRDCSSCSSCSSCSYCRDCSSCSYCRDCSSCSYCRYCSSCRSCSYCRYCRSCSYCRDCSSCRSCSDCSYCSSCSYCRYCSEKNGLSESGDKMIIPVIKNIHQKVFEAVNNGDNLDMDNWHHDCGTTHCRGGWVTTLAGKEGKALEELTSTEFAANAIYSKSSSIEVGPFHFFLTNEKSMADIEICAELEKQGKTERP